MNAEKNDRNFELCYAILKNTKNTKERFYLSWKLLKLMKILKISEGWYRSLNIDSI